MSANTLLRGVGLRRPARGRLRIRSLLLLHGSCADLTLKFFLEAITVGEDECRAWTVLLEKHFIRAETIRWDELLDAGSEANARSKGTLRLEGKDYIVQDGDVMHSRHSG